MVSHVLGGWLRASSASRRAGRSWWLLGVAFVGGAVEREVAQRGDLASIRSAMSRPNGTRARATLSPRFNLALAQAFYSRPGWMLLILRMAGLGSGLRKAGAGPLSS